jgi:dienelactone hydrolase
MRRLIFAVCSACLTIIAVACYPALKLEPSDADVVLAHHTIAAPDPGVSGPYGIARMYYGSGTDRNRREYRDSVTLKTDSVDASKFVNLGNAADERNDYWGFTTKGMPLNGRTWYPDGDGPFPLVLMVHGNHNPRDFSDPGYGYIGELLASRGYIAVSVDMNFINGTRNENDARGWFFLKHLEQWKKWNETAGNPFHGRVDMERIALVGHSRGGEAVGHAAALNRLDRYPDDANVKLDFGFSIRSLIAIAPVDGQYRPADQLVPLENVNYLVFHGSHDGDVSSFMGIRQYQRVRFTDGNPWFKAAVYVYRANHGQWNTVWGPNDNGTRSSRILDLRTLMPPEDQRRVVEVYIPAFLDATLNNDKRYLPLFRDHRVAGDWLPGTMYVTRFQESTFRPVAAFEEDVDVTTGSMAGVRVTGDSLSTWREGRLQLRTANSPAEGSSQYNNAVTLGWNNRIAGSDTTRHGPPAAYTIHLPLAMPAVNGIGPSSSLQFLLMPTDAMPGARRDPAPRDTTQAGQQQSQADVDRAEREDEDEDEDDDEKPPVDLSIEVVDAMGERASLPLNRYGAIRRPLETWILRRRDIEDDRFGAQSELVLQSYALPLADFIAANPSLDARRLTEIRFLFDRVVAGTVVIDDIGFANPDPAFGSPVTPPDSDPPDGRNR